MNRSAASLNDSGSIEVTCSEYGVPPLRFEKGFCVGRAPDCEVRVENEYVSRRHAEVSPSENGWIIRDLKSRNGLYWQGQRVETMQIVRREGIRLGIEGPELRFEVHPPVARVTERRPDEIEPTRPEEDVVSYYAQRYFRASVEGEVVGEHTGYVRRAFAQVQQKQQEQHRRQRWVYVGCIVLLTLLVTGVSAYSYHLRRQVAHQRELAHNLFYAMKSLDVEIATAEREAWIQDPVKGQETVNKYEARRKEIQANYDQFLSTLHIYNARDSEQHRLILRVARIFGECELDMPPDFEQEVTRYIKLWQSTGRFTRDVRIAREKGYARTIAQSLLERGLPVQFFYLAMQESDFDPNRSGPLTSKGYAKGMWQFIPETAVKYGLHLGPLVDLPRPDPGDGRDQMEKATDAASKYIQFLYGTDAQASGLLVMACYNWGENRVLPLVRSMPANPRERNFWRLLADHRSQVPQETYDYVFYIVSAAVIGENPRLFGFDFDNPLADALS